MGFRERIGVAALALAFTLVAWTTPASADTQRVVGGEIDTAFAGSANIALTALGGKVVASREYSQDYRKEFMIDGIRGDDHSELNARPAWDAVADDQPVDLVFAFNDEKVAKVAGFAITPWRFPASVPRDMEIFASATGADGSWFRVPGNFVFSQDLDRQGYVFDQPVDAKVLWFRLKSTFGSSYFNIGEFQIFESPGRSILEGADINIASPALGGALVRPPRGRVAAGAAIDGDLSTSYIAEPGQQQVVFTHRFRDGQPARIRGVRVHADPDASVPVPKGIRLEYATGTNPIGAYELIGETTLRWSDGAAWLPITPEFDTRYLRLTFLPDGSQAGMSISEIEILEGAGDGYESLAITGRAVVPDGRLSDTAAEIHAEQQADDTIQTARVLKVGERVAGELWPRSDVDVIRVEPVEGDVELFAKIDRTGGPEPDVQLVTGDGSGQQVPLGQDVLVPGGSHLRLSRAPRASIVLLIDDSGSMQGTNDPVTEAVKSFLVSRDADEQVAILRFSSTVDWLSDFSTDTDKLVQSVEGSLSQDGSTALYDGLITAIDALDAQSGDKAIVLLSDGANSVGEDDLQAAWDAIAGSRARLYAIGLGSSLDFYGDKAGLAATPWQVLQMFAEATNGLAVRSADATDLDRVYQTIGHDLTTPSRYDVSLVARQVQYGQVQVGYTGGLLLGQDAPVVEIILDASGSMRERKKKVDGKLKIDVAKSVIYDLIDQIPEGTRVGLRVFGQNIREGQPHACIDVQLLVPHAPINKREMKKAVAAVSPLGTTPIYTALLLALGDLRDLGPGKKKIILITDGKEECKDPEELVALARGFDGLGVDLEMDVVGFALADEQTKDVMQRAAAATGGSFTDAQDASALLEGLTGAFEQASLTVRSLDGYPDAVGQVGGPPIRVKPGRYEVDVHVPGGPMTIRSITIPPGKRLGMTLGRDADGGFTLSSNWVDAD